MSIIRILSFVIILSIVLCSSITLSGAAAVIVNTEEKVFCTATLEDNFADDQVIVIMKNTTSLEFNEYSAVDFPEISCSNVVNLMPSVTRIAEFTLCKAEASDMRGTNLVNNISDLGYKIDLNDYHQTLCLEITNPGKQNVLAAIKALETRTDILCAEPNYIVPLCSTTVNDQYFGQQWAANKIKLQQAWNITSGSSSVYVGVVDTGIFQGHSDLAGRINVSMSRDCRSGTAVPYPQHVTHGIPHGTLVAGVIGAAGNSIGISGVCRNISLVSLQVDITYSYEIVEALMTSIAAAIDYAADTLEDNNPSNNIRILNCSFGVYNGQDSVLMREAIECYGELGGLVVCSAGNQNADTDWADHFPSKYSMDYDYVISVGASTSNDQKWNSSNYGEHSVDIFAPGVNILSCYPTEMCHAMGLDCSDGHFSAGYHYADGTSLAAPHVTGVAALMLAENPNLTASEIKTIIRATANKIDAFDAMCVSDGRLNAYAAVAACHTHSFTYTTTAYTHSGTCACGATGGTAAHIWEMDIDGAQICSICGYYRIGLIKSTSDNETE